MMRGLLAPLRLVHARAHRPGRWLAPAAGIALAVAFAAAIAAEGTIAGDRAARSALAGLTALDRAIRVSWQGTLSPAAAAQVQAAFRGLDSGSPSEVVLLDPVRLDGVIVRPAAIAPLGRPVSGGLGPCRADGCPMLLAGSGRLPRVLAAPGVRILVSGSAPLRSPVPLGFSPAYTPGPPVLVTWDVSGLNALAGLSGVYRTHSRVSSLESARLHSWQLAALEARLERAQARLGASAALSGPFTGLEQARAHASAAPRRLLLAGGGALTALLLFIVLVGARLRADQLAELERLRNAGARPSQSALFVAAESGWLCAAGLLTGAGLGVGAAALLARLAGVPAGGVLAHSLIGWQAAVALAAGWLAGTALLAAAVLVRGPRLIDALALAAVAALIVVLTLDTSGGDATALMLAPLCCLAAGVIVFRGAAAVLRGGERAARRGPVLVRLALVGLARSPGLPSLAIAFLAVSVGLGGFALAYRATLARSAADQAANRVPLDAIVAPGPDFKTPLAVAPLARWSAIGRGAVLPVRRTEADYLWGGGTVTVAALGVPAAGLARIHGWRASDGSAPLPVLARRLAPAGPVRAAGPALPYGARSLALRAFSPALDVFVTADLRGPGGAIRQVPLGVAGPRRTVLRAGLPRGAWELEAFELDEPTGLELTNGHQNGENPAPETQQEVRIAIGPLTVSGGNRAPVLKVGLGSWRGVGAASGAGRSPGAGAAVIGFATSGLPGVVRPAQPTDARPIPVLADSHLAAAAGPGGHLSLTLDGLPVQARVVGTLRRFPTLAADVAGFVAADEPTLAAALDAQLPGQGRPDELWISTAHPRALRAALGRQPLAQLSSSFRSDIEHQLRSVPIARGVQGTLLAAALLWAILGVLGLLTALLGGGRADPVRRDLIAQGIGPRGLRAETRVRIVLAGALGVCAGIAIALLLTRLAVASVEAAGFLAAPRPPLVTVVPWAELAAWAVLAVTVIVLAASLVTRMGRAGARIRRAAPGSLADAGTPAEGVAR